MRGWASQLLGGGLIAVALVDLFLTVLYARGGVGVISPWVTEGVWRGFRWAGRRTLAGRDAVLTLCGPVLLVVMGLSWLGLLAVGFALIYWPMLGVRLHDADGSGPLGFGTAFYYSLTSLTTVGSGSSVVESGAPQVLVAAESAIGIATFTLMLTYFVQVYTAIVARNAMALKLHHASGGTGDAARILAGLGAAGDFEGARGTLWEWAAEMTKLYESHHLYSVLHVFRFAEAYYAPSRVIVLVMDTVSLVRSALDQEEYAALRGSAGATMLWGTGMQAMGHLSKLFLPGGRPEGGELAAEVERRWGRRYVEAARLLRGAGIKVVGDEEGAAAYVALRRMWDPYVVAFAHYMGQTVEGVDPATAKA